MTNRLKLSASAAALALLIAGGISSAQAADVVEEPGCSFNGQVMAGFMYNWQDVSTNITTDDSGDIESKDFDGDPEWETPFGEGAALVTCGGLNIQGDFAYYGHEYENDDFENKDEIEVDQHNKHGGGAIFYRDPGAWALGISASRITQEETFEDKNESIWRVGLFGEFYVGDAFTLGASGHYYDKDEAEEDGPLSKDENGFELAAWGRFYPTPNFSIMVRGDLWLPDTELDINGPVEEPVDLDFEIDDGWAVTGEAEYLVWEYGLSIFGGARYAERSWSFEVQGDDFRSKVDSDVEDFQVFAGLKFYFDFGRQRTLVDNHRMNAVDNTSVFHEKLPELITSTIAGIIEDPDEFFAEP